MTQSRIATDDEEFLGQDWHGGPAVMLLDGPDDGEDVDEDEEFDDDDDFDDEECEDDFDDEEDDE